LFVWNQADRTRSGRATRNPPSDGSGNPRTTLRIIALMLLLPPCHSLLLGLDVSHQARAVEPGEALLLTVRHSLASEVRASAFGHTIRCYESGEAGVWQALIGIDLDATPGPYLLEILVTDSEGQTSSDGYPIEVRAKDFPTRHLKVDPKYVDPPADLLARIEHETNETRAILSTVSPSRLWEGRFTRPVPGRVVSGFGKRSVYNGEPRSAHSGVDLRAPTGTAIKAPAAGRVVLVRNLYFAGNAVIIDHGLGLYSYLAHLSKFSVREGELVAKGQIVGLSGQTGRVSGPHLHWSMRLNNARIDPLSVLATAQ
jgi:murein DD-endopeptidase MepM/ murein hydrolase activator NlpD